MVAAKVEIKVSEPEPEPEPESVTEVEEEAAPVVKKTVRKVVVKK